MLPQACTLCAGAAGNALVCTPCERSLPRLCEPCPKCALPRAGSDRCGACLVHPSPFDQACAAFEYAFPVDRLLHRLKYGGAIVLADWAAAAWLQTFAHRVGSELAAPDVIVPIPLAPARQRERGYNQAQEIARRIAGELAIPMAMHLERVRDAPAQAVLPWTDRTTNVRDAFRASGPIEGRMCAIVDDVMTTGATAGDAARALRQAGAASVVVWVVARTLPPDTA